MPYVTDALLRTLFDSSLRVIAIAGGIAGVLALLKVRSSAARHAAWTAVLCAMILMPVLPTVVPRLPLPIPSLPTASIQLDQTVPTEEVLIPVPAPPAPTPQTASTAPREPMPAPAWPMILAAVYAFGVLVFLARFVVGAFAMHRFARSLSRTRFTGLGPLFESEFARAPMTMGLLHPRIILPRDWRSWPANKLRAVLAHESAHVRRRDPVVRCIARLNCCFFWFHPIAWWLDRRLSQAAEEACDDAAIRAVRDPRRYAAVLLDIADSVRTGKTRLSWQFVGADGSGLERRIDRIVSSAFVTPMSRERKAIVVVLCSTIIGTVAACARTSKPSLESELRALVKVEEVRRKSDSRNEFNNRVAAGGRFQPVEFVVHNFTPEQVSDLEAYLKKNPDDFDTRLRLLVYYRNSRGNTLAEISKILAKRREHIRWLIQTHPNDPDAASPYTFINTQPPDVLADPAAYAEIRALWLEQSNHPDASPTVLNNAAYFLQLNDKAAAEQLLDRSEKQQAGGQTTVIRAWIYAQGILGATCIQPAFNSIGGGFVPLALSAAEAHSPYADGVRRTLAASKDAELLTAVARIIGRQFPNLTVDFDVTALEKTYLERAAALDPNSDAVTELARLQTSDRQLRLLQLPKENRVEAALKLPDRDRFELLGLLASNSYAYGNSFPAAQRDEARREWEKARKYAAGLSETAAKFRKDPEYGNAIFRANTVLAFVASQNGDTEGAEKYLRDATQSSGTSEWENFGGSDPWARVCSQLIDKGRSSDVIDFLERFAQIDQRGRDDLLAAAALVRSGVRPVYYRSGQ
jgi:beta-lactamase regulating signal transducer with metallopeptidase domain